MHLLHQGKLRNRGTVCMFVGYSVDHAHDVYRMLNLETDHIIIPEILSGLSCIIKNGLIRAFKWRELQMMMMTTMSMTLYDSKNKQ